VKTKTERPELMILINSTVKYILIFSFILCCNSCGGQGPKPDPNYTIHKNTILRFYEVLFDEKANNSDLAELYWDATFDSSLLLKVRDFILDLTVDSSLIKTKSSVADVRISDQGLEFGIYLSLNLSKNQLIHLELGKDTPTYIEYIWLSDGSLLSDRLNKTTSVRYLIFAGIIKDKDGFVNIRSEPSNTASIKGKLNANELMYYTPSTQTTWWKVYSKDSQNSFLGYVHSSRVVSFNELSFAQQQEIRKIRNQE
jgi:hypothetical protein